MPDQQDPISGGEVHAFTALLTVPAGYDLTTARQSHFTFAWLLVVPCLASGLWGSGARHIQRDLARSRSELAARNPWQDIKEDARPQLKLALDAADEWCAGI